MTRKHLAVRSALTRSLTASPIRITCGRDTSSNTTTLVEAFNKDRSPASLSALPYQASGERPRKYWRVCAVVRLCAERIKEKPQHKALIIQ